MKSPKKIVILILAAASVLGVIIAISLHRQPEAALPDYSGAILKEEEGLCGCYIDETRGVLKVTGIETADYPALIPGLPEGAFHIYDYQFFFRALQKNVAVRVNRFCVKDVSNAA